MEYEKSVKLKTIENVFSALSAFYDNPGLRRAHEIQHHLAVEEKRYLRRYKEGQDDAVRRFPQPRGDEQTDKLHNGPAR